MTGLEWLCKYRKRDLNLSLRKPENTSAALLFVVTELYNNFVKV